MPVVVIMPKVDMDMSHGTVSVWHVSEGASVTKGDPLFDIETDKAAMEVESPATGTLHHVIADKGEVVPIGEPVAWIYAEGEAVGEAPAKPASATTPPTAKDMQPDADEDNPPAAGHGDRRRAKEEPPTENDPVESVETGLRATPLARRLAREQDVALDDVNGSGPRGRVQAKDIPERAVSPKSRSRRRQLPFVLIHGFASDPASWARVERELGGRRTIRMELPAHGRLINHVPTSFADFSRMMRDAFDALGEERVHLVGHSLGAAAALVIADTRSRRVASLTMISPAGLGPEIDGRAIAGIANASRVESLGPWLRTLTHDPDIISDTYIRTIMQQRRDPALRQAQMALADAVFPEGVQAFSLRAALDRVEAPARIVWGKSDRIIPWKHALSAPGRVSLNLFEHIGHMPQLECASNIAFLLQQEAE